MKKIFSHTTITILVLSAAFLFGVQEGSTHCDTLDGPVVTDARAALKSGDAAPVMKWVSPADEEAVRAAFAHTLEVRKLSPQARELADTFFFETVVRLHRASEGAPYTGLKESDPDESPAIEAADHALQQDSAEEALELVLNQVRQGIEQRFEKASHLRAVADQDVDTGREYVAAYVEFIHYVDRLYRDALSAAHAHNPAETGHDEEAPAHTAPAAAGPHAGHSHDVAH